MGTMQMNMLQHGFTCFKITEESAFQANQFLCEGNTTRTQWRILWPANILLKNVYIAPAGALDGLHRILSGMNPLQSSVADFSLVYS